MKQRKETSRKRNFWKHSENRKRQRKSTPPEKAFRVRRQEICTNKERRKLTWSPHGAGDDMPLSLSVLHTLTFHLVHAFHQVETILSFPPRRLSNSCVYNAASLFHPAPCRFSLLSNFLLSLPSRTFCFVRIHIQYLSIFTSFVLVSYLCPLAHPPFFTFSFLYFLHLPHPYPYFTHSWFFSKLKCSKHFPSSPFSLCSYTELVDASTSSLSLPELLLPHHVHRGSG